MGSKPHKPNASQFTLYHLQSQQRGLTLSAALKALVPGCSWGQAQNWITNRHVQINGNLCLDPSRRLTEKDVIKLWRESLAKPVDAEQLKLAYVDEHLVVVEKPAGVTSVKHREERVTSSRRKQRQETLEELLPAAIARHLGWAADRGAPGSRRPGSRGGRLGGRAQPALPPVYPVHRLDRDTSGLMIFARTRAAEQRLIKLFRDHRIDRQYWAVVHGHAASQVIRSTLVRDRGDGQRGSAPAGTTPEDGQSAVTHVHLVEHLPGYSIIRCKLETGRTHQIRIHLSERGHALCGDKIYTRSLDGKTVDDRSGAPRHALHSERLAFRHPITGEPLVFQMRLPPDLAGWLKRFRTRLASAEPQPEAGNAAADKDEAARQTGGDSERRDHTPHAEGS
jgi:23S rRNA pseudouridine1911/1915/1917 synthase